MASKKTLVQQPLDGHEFISVLREFRRLLSSCIGPEAGIKIIITPAGYITYTSKSSRLLNNIILENPICIYINQIIKSQMNAYQDCGLYCGTFITSLLESALTKEIGLPKPSVIKLIEYLASEMDDVFNLDCLRVKVDFSTIKQLLPLVRSILSSKPLCGLTRNEIENLQFNIVKGFIQTIGRTKGKVVVECTEGSVLGSKVFPGILYQIDHKDLLILNEKSSKEGITVILFNIMLTNDDDQKLSENRCSKIERNLKKNSFLEESLKLFEDITKLNIDIVACQKVVDPTLCHYLQRKGVLVLERLGTELTLLLEKISGATSISSIRYCPQNKLNSFIGRIDFVKQIEYGQKHYVLIQKNTGNIATLICHAQNEEAAAELKVVINQCLNALNCLISYPEVVPGAGCFDLSFSIRLMNQVMNKYHKSKFTKSQIESCLISIQMALLFSAGFSKVNSSHLSVDTIFGHMWKFNKESCCCGLISLNMVKRNANGDWVQFFNNEEILLFQNLELFSNMSSAPLSIREQSIVDLGKSKKSAIKLSVETCINLLQIGMVVYKPLSD